MIIQLKSIIEKLYNISYIENICEADEIIAVFYRGNHHIMLSDCDNEMLKIDRRILSFKIKENIASNHFSAYTGFSCSDGSWKGYLKWSSNNDAFFDQELIFFNNDSEFELIVDMYLKMEKLNANKLG